MCTNGVNTGQLEMMIDQIDDHIKLERRHAHDLGHLASDAGFTTVGEKLHNVMHLLDEVRAALDEAKEAMLQMKSRQEYQMAQATLARALNRLRVKSSTGHMEH